MKKSFILVFFLFVSSFMLGQDKESEIKQWSINLNVHYTTQHYWRGIGRGMLFGKAPAFESTLSFSNRKWQMGIFVGASMDNIYKTAMPFISYNITPQFSIAIQDIYSPGYNFWKSKPFNFNINTSKHFIDYYMVYKLKKIPINFKWASVVLGADPTKDSKRNFSSYAEVSSYYIYKNWYITGAIGYTPWKGLYATKSGINNLEAKIQYNFKLYKGEMFFPFYIKTTYNTISKYAHFIVGTSITLKLK